MERPQVSGQPCPTCGELLHWSWNEQPPQVTFNEQTGNIWTVTLMRYCIACGYRESGTIEVNQQPVFKPISE